jgi:hypothetical protein
MTLELALVARFLGETLAEAGTSGAIPTHFEACTEHDCAVQGGEDDPTPVCLTSSFLILAAGSASVSTFHLGVLNPTLLDQLYCTKPARGIYQEQRRH